MKKREHRATSKAAHESVKEHKRVRGNPELFSGDLEGEEWKEISGFEGRFEISNFGRTRTVARYVKRIKSPHFKPSFLKRTRINKYGYATVYLSINKKYTHLFVHRLVALNFVGDRPSDKHFVNHKDGKKLNNHFSNLEWVTSSENLKHAFKLGLINQNGERHPSNKLNNKQVLNIFNSSLSNKELAKKFKVSIGNIGCIKSGKTWSHLTGKLYKKLNHDSQSSTL